MTAARCMRLPFTSTSVLSGGSPRRLTGRTSVAASEIGCVVTLNDGTSVRMMFTASLSPWFTSSSPDTTSTGAIESIAERDSVRVPVTMTTSSSPACCAVAIGTPTVPIASNIAAPRNNFIRISSRSMSVF